MSTQRRPPLPWSAERPAPLNPQSFPSPLAKSWGRHTEEDPLFETPADLICPITHEVYNEPVLNHAGQVYERAAVEQHLARHNTDPITGARLATKALTPVYFLKSRAQEFRNAAARTCLERATAVGGHNAIRYVRRAAELCDALPAPVPGLSRECLEYIRQHPSNVYDMPALHLFAAGLLQAGMRDRAAAVFYSLLQDGADKAQQASLLKQCLACWGAGLAATREEDAADSQDAIEKLVAFVEQGEGPTGSQIIDIAQEASLDHSLVTRFCEQLLFKTERSADVSLSPREWTQQKQVLLKYVQVSCGYISRQQAVADVRMQHVAEQVEQLRAMIQNQPPAPKPEERRSEKRPARIAAAATLVVTSILHPNLAAVKLVRAATLLTFIHLSQRR